VVRWLEPMPQDDVVDDRSGGVGFPGWAGVKARKSTSSASRPMRVSLSLAARLVAKRSPRARQRRSRPDSTPSDGNPCRLTSG
jgi:hypothetical protein